MSGRKRRKVPPRLVRVQQRFAAWRRTRKPRTRIPEPLWASAVKSAARCGLHQTASALKLDYYSLKRRLEQTVPESVSARAAFIEVPTPVLAPLGECVIEFEDAQPFPDRS